MPNNNQQKRAGFSRSTYARSPEVDERVKQARARAAAYRSGNLEEAEALTEKKPRSVEEWTDIVGKRIEEAMRHGAFDNLPGKGKPLDLNRDPFVPEEQQMAFKLLKNNDLSPAWIGDRNDILRRIDRLRADLRQTGEELRDALAVAQQSSLSSGETATEALCQRFLQKWELEVNQLNRLILILNLKQPLSHLEIIQLRLRDELQQAEVIDLLQL